MSYIKFLIGDKTYRSDTDFGLIRDLPISPPALSNDERVGEIYFWVTNPEGVTLAYAAFANLEGKYVFDCDLGYYYTGGWDLSIRQDKLCCRYRLDKYKWAIDESDSKWKWDTFNFKNDTISYSYFTNRVASFPTAFESFGVTRETLHELIGDAPVKPIFNNKSENPMTFKLNDKEYEVPARTRLSFDDAIFDTNGLINLSVKGNGTYDVIFRKGVL